MFHQHSLTQNNKVSLRTKQNKITTGFRRKKFSCHALERTKNIQSTFNNDLAKLYQGSVEILATAKCTQNIITSVKQHGHQRTCQNYFILKTV